MKKTILIVALLTTVLFNGNVFAFDQQERQQRKGTVLKQFMQLSETQQAQIKEIRTEFRKETTGLHEAMKDKYQQMHLMMDSTSSNELQVILNEISVIQKQLMEKRINFVMAVKKIAPEFQPDRNYKKDGEKKGNIHHVKDGHPSNLIN